MPQSYSIAMVCDFFYPNMGGVEMHIYQLSQCLIDRGHRVIMITHSYGDDFQRTGVRYMAQGLKVFYLPMKQFYNQCILPTLYSSFPLIRDILIRESIDIVHSHSAFSALGLESLCHARCLGLTTVFTDHSLFGFADISSILTNKLLEYCLADTTHIICVSHTSKENTVLRAFIDPVDVSVIPNAIDASMFTPDPSRRDPKKITIVVVSRLVYRKGADLLIGIIPTICKKFADVEFLVVGDGPKRLLLEELREQHQLHSRVHLLGSLPNDKIRDMIVKGHIFVNTSLTEAFCIAIVEAIACGLQVVSTNVGGIPEVVPEGMIRLADASVQSLTREVEAAIMDHKHGRTMSPTELYERVKVMYTWPNVAARTEKVYQLSITKTKRDFWSRLKRYYNLGPVGGKVFFIIALLNQLCVYFFEWLRPAKLIDKIPSASNLRGFPHFKVE